MNAAEEHEADRRRLIAEADADREDRAWRARYAPGGFGCHEALHMASRLGQLVEAELTEHPAVVLNAEWFALARRASDALHDLYQAIGAAHLGGAGEEPAS